MSRDERSKTQRKREAEALQKLGEELIALAPDKLAAIELPAPLRSAIESARGMHQHGALRRQKQLVGKLMRDVDPEPIRAMLEHLREPGRRAATHLHRVEEWRDRLIAEGDDALRAFSEAFPGADVDLLGELVFRARQNPRDKKPRRALFRQINDLLNSRQPTAQRVGKTVE